jgi:dTDP-4-amino-4,6-dideoxygalactose transaminase
MTKVPFLDLRVTDDDERRELLEAVEKVLVHGRILLGPEVDELQQQVARRVGTKYAVGCNSGTDALIIAMKALGIGAGDEVIVPALSFIATANAVLLCGGQPVFADLGDDLNIDIDSMESLITPATKAVIPVHWAGRMCDMERLVAIANRRNLHVVEDASQSFDASFRGRKAGTYGIIGCFSMNSMKVFASLGEAGMIVTDDTQLYDRCISLRYHGLVNREYCTALAQNSRIDTLQAAALLVRLKRLDSIIDKRRKNAAYYNKRLSNAVTVPLEGSDERHVYYTYTIQSDRRDALKDHLESKGIEVKIQHPLLMPQHPIYLNRAKGSWSRADSLIKRVLCIPANEKLTPEQLATVADTVLSFPQN